MVVKHLTMRDLFQPGQTVWRPRVDKIEEGTVTGVERCIIDCTGGSARPHPEGKHWLAHARFRYDHVSQTSEHRFFATQKGALLALAWEAGIEAEKSRYLFEKWMAVAKQARADAKQETATCSMDRPQRS